MNCPCSDAGDTHGPNAGMFELASGAEVNGYFQRVMHQKLIPSGRVRYLPMSEFLGVNGDVGQVRGIFSGQESHITVRKKWVDATFFSPQVPATTAPAFAVAEGVDLVTPTQLTQLWQRPSHRQVRRPRGETGQRSIRTGRSCCHDLPTNGH